MLEYEEIHQFIKRNSKVISLNINYTPDTNEYIYVVNVNGLNHTLKIILDLTDNSVVLEYKSNLIRYSNDIQLELFEIFNYKNIEYIDCYIFKKKIINDFDIIDMYDDYYDNDNDELISNRTIIKDEKPIKIKFVCHDNEMTMEYNMEKIIGFEEIIEKLDLIL
jgi:hypothetical protein